MSKTILFQEQEKAPEYEKLRELQNSAKPLSELEKKKINISYFLRKIGFLKSFANEVSRKDFI